MHYKIPFLISYISQTLTLNEGDILLTGTPAGVGPIEHDDIIEGSLKQGEEVLAHFNWTVEKQ